MVRSVCADCNSRLGYEVDSVADNYLMTFIRAEAGLRPNRGVSVNCHDPDLNMRIEAVWDARGQ